MNGGAYGGDFASVLVRALVATADGTGWLTPAELGLSYRHSNLRHGQVILQAELRLRPRPPEEIKAVVRDLNAQRKAAQPTNRRTFGSVFKNPDHELSAGRMLEACGLRGHRIGGAQISPKHANFIENAGGARTADALALMAEARRRALARVRRRARARGRVPRRDRAAPDVGAPAGAANLRPNGRQAACACHCDRPPGSSLTGAYFAARETSTFSVRTIDVSGGTPALQARVRTALAPVVGRRAFWP